MPDTFLRSDFASETESKQVAPVERAQECFLRNGTGQGEAPKDVNLTGRATSKTEIQKYLQERRKERQRKYQRKYMKKHRKAEKRAERARIHPTLSNEEALALIEAASYA